MKTTIAGILTIIAALAGAAVHVLVTGHLPDAAGFTAISAAIATGIGLIHAQDALKP